MGSTALLAFAASAVQPLVVPNPQENVHPYLQLWIGVAAVSVICVALELIARCPKSDSPLQREQTLRGSHADALAFAQVAQQAVVGGIRLHEGGDARDSGVARPNELEGLDGAAADAVKRWRFEPARRGDDPVAMWVMPPVEFRLR